MGLWRRNIPEEPEGVKDYNELGPMHKGRNFWMVFWAVRANSWVKHGICVCARMRETIPEAEADLPWSKLGRGLTYVEHLLCASYLYHVL